MQFCLQLAPHANIRYRDAQVKLGQAELTCLLCALSLPAETQVTTIGGVPCLTFSAKALPPEALALLGTHSTRLMLFECVAVCCARWIGDALPICPTTSRRF